MPRSKSLFTLRVDADRLDQLRDSLVLEVSPDAPKSGAAAEALNMMLIALDALREQREHLGSGGSLH